MKSKDSKKMPVGAPDPLDLEKDKAEFLKSGRAVEELPPQVLRPRRNREVPKLVRPHVAQWEEEELTKAESLLYKLNISGQDPLAIPGTQQTKLTTFDVWSALVSIRTDQLARHPTWGYMTAKKIKLIVVELQVYRQLLLADGKRDLGSHRVLFQELLYLIIDRKNSESWEVRKSGILENIVLTAIEHVCNPARYRDLSARAWARQLGLSDHKAWQRFWKKRYEDFLNDLTALDVFTADELERQL